MTQTPKEKAWESLERTNSFKVDDDTGLLNISDMEFEQAIDIALEEQKKEELEFLKLIETDYRLTKKISTKEIRERIKQLESNNNKHK